MAVDLCSSENSSMGMSPRISFSYDLCQSDVAAAVEHQHRPLKSNSSPTRSLNSSMEFDFCVGEGFEQDASSADELFSHGKMIPTEIKKKFAQPKQLDQITPRHYPPLPIAQADLRDQNISTSKESRKESKIMSSNEADEKQSSRSFWRFKRSSSCGSGYGRSLCPLPLLSRSNSTGSSSSSVKRSLFSKEGLNQKHSSHKSASKKLSSLSSTSSSSQSQSYASMNYQKPPLKKNQYGSYGNAVPFNPVLNVPTANLLGFGLIFSNGKDKSKKK